MKIRFLLFFCVILCSFACKKEMVIQDSSVTIAVFLPGVRAESPIYGKLADGVEKAVAEAPQKVHLEILEAGTNQADWSLKMMSLVAEQKYDLIVTSNTAMPEIIAPISKQFSNQKFLIFDAYAEGNPALTTFRYNQREQGYIAGHMAALVSSSSLSLVKKDHKQLGLIAGQEYPAMMNVILPAFKEGARAVDQQFDVDFRIVGNWYDASKAAELARVMYKSGCDVILPISGGANQGVIAAAKESGGYVMWSDSNGFQKAPHNVIGSVILCQDVLAYKVISQFIAGTLKMGVPSTVGVKDECIVFVEDDPLYIKAIPETIRSAQSEMLKKIISGELDLSVE